MGSGGGGARRTSAMQCYIVACYPMLYITQHVLMVAKNHQFLYFCSVTQYSCQLCYNIVQHMLFYRVLESATATPIIYTRIYIYIYIYIPFYFPLLATVLCTFITICNNTMDLF